MDLTQLRYFVEAARSGTLSLASERLFITQPALSKQIAKLEQEFHIQLFERSNHGITLTSIGKSFLPKAEEIVNEMDKAYAFLSGFKHGQSGTMPLRVGLDGAILGIPVIRQVFIDTIDDVRDSNLSINVEFERAEFNVLKEGLASHRFDLGLFSCHDMNMLSEYETCCLVRSPMCLFVSKKIPLPESNEDLCSFIQSHTVIHMDNNPYMRMHVTEIYRGLNVSPKERIMPDKFSVLTAIAKGDGIGIFPKVILMKEEYTAFNSCVLPAELPPYLCAVGYSELSPAIAEFTNKFKERMAQQVI